MTKRCKRKHDPVLLYRPLSVVQRPPDEYATSGQTMAETVDEWAAEEAVRTRVRHRRGQDLVRIEVARGLRDRVRSELERVGGDIAAKARLAVRLAASEYTNAEIAECLGTTEKIVAKYLALAVKRFSMRQAGRVEKLRAMNVIKARETQRQIVEHIDRANEDEVSVSEKTLPGGKKIRTTKRKGKVANPAYFRALLEAQKRESELLGLDAPKKVDLEHTRKLSIVLPVFHTREQWEEHQKQIEDATDGEVIDVTPEQPGNPAES